MPLWRFALYFLALAALSTVLLPSVMLAASP